MKHKSNGKGNGKSNGHDRQGVRALHQHEKIELQKLNQSVADKKMRLAQLVWEFEAQKNALCVEIGAGTDAFLTAVRAAANGHGVDPDGDEKWNLDLDRAVFHRVGADTVAAS